MNDDAGLRKLGESILDGSIFEKDVLSLAEENGFTVYNTAMDDADGFIVVNEKGKLPGYDGHKIIGVNANKDIKMKKELVAQELCRYYALKMSCHNKSIKFAHRSTLILRKDKFNELIIPPETKQAISIEKKLKMVENNINTVLSQPVYSMARETGEDVHDVYEWDETVFCYNSELIRSQDEMTGNPFQSDMQRARDLQVAELLSGYVRLYKQREFHRIKSRGILLWFCIIMAAGLIVSSLVLLFMWIPHVAKSYETTTTAMAVETPAGGEKGFSVADLFIGVASADENTPGETAAGTSAASSFGMGDVKDYVDSVLNSDASNAAKDIVAIVSICVTILGSIFGLLKMVAKYVLPLNEESNMQRFVDTIQENDFKNQMVMMLYRNSMFEDITTYLGMKKDSETQSGTNNLKPPETE
jgi:hypothetical protein